MKAILQSVRTVPGVNGVFVCNTQGELLGREMPTIFDDRMLRQAGEVASRAIAGLESAGSVGSVDFSFADCRLVAKNLGAGALCVLCSPSTNASFLNLTANVAAERVRRVIEEGGGQQAPPRQERLQALVRQALGPQATKALEILEKAGESRAELLEAADEIARLTRLFISKKKANELVEKLQSIIAE